MMYFFIDSKAHTMLDDIFEIAKQENKEQNGNFMRVDCVDTYLAKLRISAEFIAHVIGNNIAGFAAFYCNNTEDNESFISLIVTSPEFRGKKVGSTLIDSVLNITRSRGFNACALEVARPNKNAIALYERKGFRIVENKDDSFIMRIDLI